MTPVISTGDPRVRRYDFNHQEAIDRSRLRRLQPVMEAAAHRMAGSLTVNLRQPVRITVDGFEQSPWEEYAATVEDPTYLASASLLGLDGRVVLHLPVALALALVDVQLGGSGGPQPERLTLTDIERLLVGSMVDDMFAALPSAFDAFVDLRVGVVQKLTSSIYLKAGRPGEMCLFAALSVVIGESPPRTVHLCIPLTVLHPVLDAFERLQQAEGGGGGHGPSNAVERLLAVPVEVQVAYPPIGLTPSELLDLQAGDVIPLHADKDAQRTPLELVVGGVGVGRGVLVEQGKRLACTVVDWNEEMR